MGDSGLTRPKALEEGGCAQGSASGFSHVIRFSPSAAGAALLALGETGKPGLRTSPSSSVGVFLEWVPGEGLVAGMKGT